MPLIPTPLRGFHRVAKAEILEQASSYVMWVAGHGGEAATLNTYLAALHRFPDSWDRWAGSLDGADLFATIPILKKYLPIITYESEGEPEAGGKTVPMPPDVQVCVTLALQQSLMEDKGLEPEGVRASRRSSFITSPLASQQTANATCLSAILYGQLKYRGY